MTIKRILLLLAALSVLALFGGCAARPGDEPAAGEPASPGPQEESRVFGEISETTSVYTGEISIERLGVFTFNPQEVKTVREDLFRPGHFSIFDVLVHLEQAGQIDMDYHFDESMNTYVIADLDGHAYWWYDAYYDGGWRENSVFRMDHYPYKDKMTLRLVREPQGYVGYLYREYEQAYYETSQRSSNPQEYLESIYKTYRDEVQRREENGGRIIVPEVIIIGTDETLVFENVEIKAHNLRPDMFQPGVVTAIDTILSLAAEGKISYDLQWYESLGTADVVKSYWVNRINEDESYGRCGFVYEAGSEVYDFFRGNHNHIPSDVRVINSPEYVKYFWICI